MSSHRSDCTARDFEYEDRSPFGTSERQRLGYPCGIDFGCERVFMFQPPETLRRRILCRHSHYKYGRLGAFLPATVRGEFYTFLNESPKNSRLISAIPFA
jgi:hypothetical protein